MKILYKKICIVGPAGAGKSTIASEISRRTGLPHIEVDKIVWTIADGIYLRNDRDKVLSEIKFQSLKNEWIVEGSYEATIDSCMKEADIIIYLAPNILIRIQRLFRRYFTNKFGTAPKTETFMNTLDLIRYTFVYPFRLRKKFQSSPDLLVKIKRCRNAKNLFKVLCNQ